MSVRKFNPGLNQTDEEVIQQFVVRENLLNQLVSTARLNTDSDSNQHMLFYGPRGRGKTMLMTRFEIAVRMDSQLSTKWIVVRLFEEAYYEIDSAGELWLAIMEELSKTNGHEFAESLVSSCEELRAEKGRAFEQKTIAVFNDILDRLPQGLIVIVENLQDLAEEIDDEQAWTIRKLLQNQPNLMLVATATSFFSELSATNHAFFELFDTQNVKPLNRSEATTLWNFLANENRNETDVRPLQILTGGSPRLLTMMAQFAVQLSIRELMEELSGLIDERTDYFKSQIESLPKVERRVFVALADLWDYSTAKEIADSARMEVAKVSSLLNRLEKRGALDVDSTEPRKKRYAVTERLACLYYKMRRRRDESVIAWYIVNFARVYYSLDQRQVIETEYVGEYIVKPALSQFKVEPEARASDLRAYAKSAAEELKFDEPRLAVAELEIQLSHYLNNEDLVDSQPVDDAKSVLDTELKVIFERAHTYLLENRFDDALTELQCVVGEFEENEKDYSLCTVAIVTMIISEILELKGDIDDAVANYDQLIAKFRDSETIQALELVALTMFNRASTIGENGDVERAIASYDQLIEKFWDSEVIRIQVQVGRAMLNRAIVIGNNGEFEGVVVDYDQLIEKFGNSEAIEIQESVARAILNRAITIGENGDSEGEMAGYDQLMAKFGDSESVLIQEQVALSMVNRAFAIGKNGDTERAIGGYDQLIAKFSNSEAVQIKKLLAIAMYSRGFNIYENGDIEGSIASYDRLIDKFGDSETLQIKKLVAKAMVSRAFAIGANGDTEGAIAGYNQLISRCQHHPDLEEQVNSSIVNRNLTVLLAGGSINDLTFNNLPKGSIVAQLCFMIAELVNWASLKGDADTRAVRLLARKVLNQPDHENERLELGLGVAAIMEPTDALNVLYDSGALDELKPIAVYLERQCDSSKREVFELSEMADDVEQRVGELHDQLFRL